MVVHREGEIMNKQSLCIGILLGVCLCLVFALFQNQEAQAQTKVSRPRYQISNIGNMSSGHVVINQDTGSVYELLVSTKGYRWKKIASGPRR